MSDAPASGGGAGHTPGPWTIGAEDLAHHNVARHAFLEDPGGYRIDAPGIEQVCYVWNETRRFPADGGPQSEGPQFGSRSGLADARLIAAAPDLLAALERMNAAFSDFGSNAYSKTKERVAAIHAARAALSLARTGASDNA